MESMIGARDQHLLAFIQHISMPRTCTQAPCTLHPAPCAARRAPWALYRVLSRSLSHTHTLSLYLVPLIQYVAGLGARHAIHAERCFQHRPPCLRMQACASKHADVHTCALCVTHARPSVDTRARTHARACLYTVVCSRARLASVTRGPARATELLPCGRCSSLAAPHACCLPVAPPLSCAAAWAGGDARERLCARPAAHVSPSTRGGIAASRSCPSCAPLQAAPAATSDTGLELLQVPELSLSSGGIAAPCRRLLLPSSGPAPGRRTDAAADAPGSSEH